MKEIECTVIKTTRAVINNVLFSSDSLMCYVSTEIFKPNLLLFVVVRKIILNLFSYVKVTEWIPIEFTDINT